eukprot:4948232-Alexandrium_andersonii.AAC.1
MSRPPHLRRRLPQSLLIRAGLAVTARGVCPGPLRVSGTLLRRLYPRLMRPLHRSPCRPPSTDGGYGRATPMPTTSAEQGSLAPTSQL